MDLQNLIGALARTAAFPQPADTVLVRQTHISVVFLVGRYAYKIKKPVAFGFLDYTDVERRLHFCREEVRLNARLAKDVYLGVVPITRDDQGLHMEGAAGETIEWAVKMRRLRDEDSLEQRQARNAFPVEIAEEVGRRIAIFHASAQRSPLIAEHARFDNVKVLLSENIEQASTQSGDAVSPEVIDRVRRLTEAALAAQRERIDERAEQGRPCDTHGDLRLEHIYLLPQKAPDDIAIVDCIEFSERYRYADPVSDVAFLVMDLHYRGRRDLASALMESYFNASGDEESRSLIPLYCAYRAIVRAKVEALKAGETELPAEERATALDRVKAYWLLALGELETPSRRPCLLLIGGLPGTGKSTLARQLADTQGFAVIRSDEIRKSLAGVQQGASAASEFKKGIYTPEWTQRTYAECLRLAECALSSGERVAIDASFGSGENRDRFIALAQRMCVPMGLLICHADPDIVRQRLMERRLDASDADWKIYEQAAQAWEPVEVKAAIGAHVVSTNEGAAQALERASAIVTKINNP